MEKDVDLYNQGILILMTGVGLVYMVSIRNVGIVLTT